MTRTTLKRQINYPYNLDYICAAFPPRSGYLAVKKDPANYKLYNIERGKKWEMVFPPKKYPEYAWIGTCKKQYIGPDLVMIDDHTYTTFIKMF
ncbi:UNVERIFIED_CONTAM: hypothetical protein PYX00_003046 [Menopon gallinae]|uniref:Uncharacterized protein n=1 Tax=Menopon gallinae TaxID=328185 RepID=A0AAW2HZN4_9NEOP